MILIQKSHFCNILRESLLGELHYIAYFSDLCQTDFRSVSSVLVYMFLLFYLIYSLIQYDYIKNPYLSIMTSQVSKNVNYLGLHVSWN
jgi:hypothetical protein